jgi:hypothetical protein
LSTQIRLFFARRRKQIAQSPRARAHDPLLLQPAPGRWAAALRSGNGEELVRVLAGRRAGRKLTSQIEAYVRARWADLSRSGTYGIGKRLRERNEEIESVFEVKLSQETLRPLVGQLKRQPVVDKHRAGEEPAGTAQESGTVPTGSDDEIAHTPHRRI